MRSHSSGRTISGLENARDTVLVEMPSFRAISLMLLYPRQPDTCLVLVLSLLVLIGDAAHVICSHEEDLSNPLVSIDLDGERRRVTDLDGHETFPFGLKRCHVNNNARSRICTLANDKAQDIPGNPEVLETACKSEGVRRDDAGVTVHVHETSPSERLWIDNGIEDIGEDLELVRHTHVISIGRHAI